MDRNQLINKTLIELKSIAKELGVKGVSKKNKTQLTEDILSKSSSEKDVSTSISETTKASKEKTPVVEIKDKVEKPIKKATPDEITKAPSPKVSTPSQSATVPAPTPKPLSQTKEIDNVSNKDVQKEMNVVPPTKSPQVHQSNQSQNQKKPHGGHRQNQRPNGRDNSRFTNNHNNNNDDKKIDVTGVLEILQDSSHGVLRSQKLVPSDRDTYISLSQVKKFNLRKGDFVKGIARLPKDNERYYSLLWIKEVNGTSADKLTKRPRFDEFRPIYPDKQLKLEVGQYPIANRIIDILSPIGYGQRSMIVAPPKSGKTFLLKDIAKGLNANYPEVQLVVVLIGERPEEVTDIERSVDGIVYASNFDEDPSHQVSVAELSLERAKRMVELGQDVVILMDSLTRLSRAYNVALPASGRTLSGGLDPASLYPSKRFFGAARNFENGASLTIIATALVDTGSKMDDVIFEEFKGTGNNELYLDRRLAEQRVYPTINWERSSTRNEELLLSPEHLQASWKIRRMLKSLDKDASIAIIDQMKMTKSNDEFLKNMG